MSYIIYYGTEDPDEEDLSFSVVVPEGYVSEYTVTGIAFGGVLRVGVAAVNSAGSSQVTHSQHSVGMSALHYSIMWISKLHGERPSICL